MRRCKKCDPESYVVLKRWRVNGRMRKLKENILGTFRETGMRGYIYGLEDPRVLGKIRYIGRTVAPLEFRLMHHIKEARWFKERDFKRSHKHNWILKLLTEDVAPKIVLLKTIDSSSDLLIELIAEEEITISEYKESGAELTNTMDGGQGWTTGQLKALWNDQEWREKQIELIRNAQGKDGYRENLLAGKKKLWENKEYADKMIATLQEKYNDPEVAEYRLTNLRAARNSEESRERTSKATKNSWEDPVSRKKRIEGMVGAAATPEGRAIRLKCVSKASEATKRKIKYIETGLVFDSITEAAKKMKLNNAALRNHLLGLAKSIGGYHFKYCD